MPPTDERAAFERIVRERYDHDSFTRCDDGYISTARHVALRSTYASVQMLHEMWEEGIAWERERAAKACENAGDGQASYVVYNLLEAAAAIRKGAASKPDEERG